MSGGAEIDRRRVIASAAAAAASAMVPQAALAQRKGGGLERPATEKAASTLPPGPGRRFFTEREFATLDEFAEMLIPADESSGGARAAKVAEHLDRRVGESRDPAFKQGWREDLEELDNVAREMFGKPFTATTLEQRHRLMRRISRNEASPKTDGEYTFGGLKWQIAEVYYRSSIGIHDEMKYMGNVAQDELSGYDPTPLERK